MLAIAKYKVIREYEHEGENLMLGFELVLKDSEGESLVQKGKLQLVKYLDPDNEEDKKIITDFKEKQDSKHAVEVKVNEDRDAVTDAALKAKDEEDAADDETVDDEEFTTHIITEEDLELNPELAEEGIVVGDEVQLPKALTLEEAREQGIDIEKVQEEVKKKTKKKK